jgi:hypothetical protein
MTEKQKALSLKALEDLGERVLRLEDIRRIRRAVVPAVSESEVLQYMIEEEILTEVNLRSEEYPSYRRFLFRGASPFEVALSLRRDSYLSHGSAVFVHNLTDQLPLRIYANREQTAKPPSEGILTQAGIDKAFARPARETRYILRGPGYDVVLLNGKSTENLEVGILQGAQGELLHATKLERTLIDIVVRPNYSGGVFQVLEAYRAAKPRVSLGVLLAVLKRLNYVYPYHQAIGFYMERAGYSEEILKRMQELGMDYDFYLAYGVEKRMYSERWRLFYPEAF